MDLWQTSQKMAHTTLFGGVKWNATVVVLGTLAFFLCADLLVTRWHAAGFGWPVAGWGLALLVLGHSVLVSIVRLRALRLNPPS